MSLVDLVGLVPEEILNGMIISYGSASGIAVYESGTRTGDTVVIVATLYPRVYEADWVPNHRVAIFGCLGQLPLFDHLAGVVPASTLRAYDGSGIEVTSQIDWMRIETMGLEQPLADSRQPIRYPIAEYGSNRPDPIPIGPDGLNLPANSGCEIQIAGGTYYSLTGVFTFSFAPPVQASVVGSQSATFQSYIGVGEMGIFEPLMKQLRSRYSERHGRIPLDIPEGADYFLFKFPPMGADPYADWGKPRWYNADRPTGGTYRLSSNGLSSNLTFSAAFPWDPAWRDADQAPGADFLPLLSHPGELAPPEYMIPAGIPYNDCFTQGNCSGAVLEQIYKAVMPVEIIYLAVSPPSTAGQWVPLKMAGPAWVQGGLSSTGPRTGGEKPTVFNHRIYLPLQIKPLSPPDPVNCPCGWFDSLGQMLYYLPGN